MMIRFERISSRAAPCDPGTQYRFGGGPRDARPIDEGRALLSAASALAANFICASAIAARSALKGCDVAHALFDVFAVGFLAAFASLFGFAIIAAFVVLLWGFH